MSFRRIIAGGVTKESSNALFITSIDGSTWDIIPKSNLVGGVNWIKTNAIKYWANRWVAVGKGTMNNGASQMPVITSNDGINWGPVTLPYISQTADYEIKAVDYSGGAWLLCGTAFYDNQDHPLLYKSTNGVQWTVVFNPTDGHFGSLNDLQWVDNSWVIVGHRYDLDEHNHYIYKSTNSDASNLTTNIWFTYFGDPIAVTIFKHKLLVVGETSPFLHEMTSGGANNINTPLIYGINDTSIQRTTNYIDQRIVICGWTNNGTHIIWSDDGLNYTQALPSNVYNSNVYCVSKFFGNNILAGAGCTDGYILKSTDRGETWSISTDSKPQKNFITINNIEVAFN